mgnify:CR=1 FL=1
MSYKIKTISYNHRVRFFWTLIAVSSLALFTYIYTINVTARNIAERETLEREIERISTNLDSLEFSYVKLKNNVTLELALGRGFRETRNPLYISRSRVSSLSFNAR